MLINAIGMGESGSDIQKGICEGAVCKKGIRCGCSVMAVSASESDEFRAILTKAVENIAKLTETVHILKNE